MKVISNTDLTEGILPPPVTSWYIASGFAHNFNGYEHWGSFEKCADVANQGREHFQKLKLPPSTLTDLRTCLFFEARRWRHYGYDPGVDDMVYIHALVEEIRRRVRYTSFH